jgi:eukaryotic-like serine/threonine-protein kinase
VDTTTQDPLVGHLLDGRYQVKSRIARGGMASVYLAMDTRLDRTVAVKVMHAGLAADQDFVARFIREAKSAARLSHPNVVAVFDQGTDGDAVFLAMEYVEGHTLRDVLRERGRLTPREALDVLEPVLAALGAAHRAGIVHRDVKPENVLLADDGRVKVADFGLARAVTASTSTTAAAGVLIGTVSYLSPEQVERGVADPRSDVYAAGILLFELLTGDKPFAGDSPIQVAYRHVHEEVPAPSSRVPELAPALDDLVRRATSREPDARPTDATRMLAELVAVRRSLPAEQLDVASAPDRTLVVPRAGTDLTKVVPVVTEAPVGSPGRRRWGRALLAALLLVAALAGGAGWYAVAGPGAYTTTPSLLALGRDQAEAKAAAAGLDVRFADPGAYSETVPLGKVVETDPGPGERVKKEGTVTVTLSRGPQRFEVPVLAGRSLADARGLLEEANLALGDIDSRYDEQVPADHVVSAEPGAGKRLRRDTPVNLIVSKGREPIPVTNYAGKPATTATESLTGRGLDVAVRRRFDDQVAKGVVISQEPASGTLFRGDTVTLVVSQGPPLVLVPDVVDRKLDVASRILTEAGFQVRTRGSGLLDRVVFQSPGGGRSAPRGSTVTLTTI